MRTVLMKCARSHMHTRVCSAKPLTLSSSWALPPPPQALDCAAGGLGYACPPLVPGPQSAAGPAYRIRGGGRG